MCDEVSSDYYGAPLLEPDVNWPNGRPTWPPRILDTPVTDAPSTPVLTRFERPCDQVKKPRFMPNKNSAKNKGRRSTRKRLTYEETDISEVDTLRSELRSVHAAYSEQIMAKDKKIRDMKATHSKLSLEYHDIRQEIDAAHDTQALEMQTDIDDLQNNLDITEGELSIYQKSEKEWTGRALKLKYLLSEIQKIGALPPDHAEWVYPLVDDLDFPEVSINIRDEFIPTAQTDNIDWTDEEEDVEVDDDDDEDDDEDDDIIGGVVSVIRRTVSRLDQPQENETEIHDEHGTLIGFHHWSPPSVEPDEDQNIDEFGSMLDDEQFMSDRVDQMCPSTEMACSEFLKEISAETIQKAWKVWRGSPGRANWLLRGFRALDEDLDEYMAISRVRQWQDLSFLTSSVSHAVRHSLP